MTCKYVYVSSHIKIDLSHIYLFKCAFSSALDKMRTTKEKERSYMSNIKLTDLPKDETETIKTQILLENTNANAPLRSVYINTYREFEIVNFKFNMNTTSDKPLCVANSDMMFFLNDLSFMQKKDSMHFKDLLVNRINKIKEITYEYPEKLGNKYLTLWNEIFKLINVLFNVTTVVDRFSKYTSLRSAHANVSVDDNAKVRNLGPLSLRNLIYAQTRNAMFDNVEAFVYDIEDMRDKLRTHLDVFDEMKKASHLCRDFDIGAEIYFEENEAQYLLVLVGQNKLMTWCTFNINRAPNEIIEIYVNFLCASGNRTGTIVLDLLRLIGCLNGKGKGVRLSLASLESSVKFYEIYGLIQEGIDSETGLPFMTNTYDCGEQITNIASRFKHVSVHSKLSNPTPVTSLNLKKRKHVDLQFEEMKQNDLLHKPKKIKTMTRGYARIPSIRMSSKLIQTLHRLDLLQNVFAKKMI